MPFWKNDKQAGRYERMNANENTSVLIEELDAKQGKLGLLTLNAEATLNSLTLEMVQALSNQLKRWEQDDAIAGVILKGAGSKAFCAGGDVQQLYQSAVEQPGGPCEYAEAFFLHEYQLDYQIHQYAKPVICLGHGIVMGGGLGLMAGAVFRVAAETTRIAMPEITIGLFPDVGGTWFLNKMPRALGQFFALTGAQINANDALYLNLATHVIAWEQQQSLIDELCACSFENTQKDDIATIEKVLGKHVIESSKLDQDLPSEIKPVLSSLEQASQSTSLGEMLKAFSQLADQSPWLEKAVETLQHGSPLSSLLIYEQLKRHRYSSLREVFLSEYQLATNVVRYPEFAEGVRALLIDKDKNPQWQFKHFSAVPASLLEQFFTPAWNENPLAALIQD